MFKEILRTIMTSQITQFLFPVAFIVFALVVMIYIDKKQDGENE